MVSPDKIWYHLFEVPFYCLKYVPKGVIMNQLKEQLFPAEFISHYIQKETGKNRFLTYVLFRFFASKGKDGSALPSLLKEHLSCTFRPEDYSVIEDFLTADYYFSPTLALNTYEPFYLYAAIHLVSSASPKERSFLEEQLAACSPVAAGLSYQDPDLDLAALLSTEQDFYAALYLATTRYEASLPGILRKFTEAYEEAYHFTCEDFILFDFMDEYFEQKNCRQYPSFIELVDTLVAATLNYYNTDFGTLLEKEAALSLTGCASRFAGVKRFGSAGLPTITDTDKACHMLAELFRYAAIYELRNNLFDFHLEDDRLITLENWKEHLRWHYVQYANVYEMALDTFHTAVLSRELLKRQFTENISQHNKVRS